MRAVEVTGLDRRFGSTRVLTSLELTVEHGEHITITGANGSGKTTLLRVLAGLLRPTAGDIRVLGGSTADPDVRRRIGVVGHSPSLYTRMTAAENIRFWAGMYGDPSALAKGADILRALGLDPADRRPVGSYSQGMRQRVSLARALAPSPELVLADEPFAGLDESGAGVVAALLRDVPTVVIATHGGMDGRRLVLHDGRLSAA